MPDVYFNSAYLPKSEKGYIAFIDIMGTKNHMQSSIETAANYIFKFHAAILTSWRKSYSEQSVFVYPVMDGVYISSSCKDAIERVLVSIYSQLTGTIINEKQDQHKFVIRGSIAYGKIVYGHRIPYQASKVFEMDLNYKNNILLGRPMIAAYENEKRAAPFGIFLDRSATKRGHFSSDWKWFKSSVEEVGSDTIGKLREELNKYFDEKKASQNYTSAKIKEHRCLVEKYFAECQ